MAEVPSVSSGAAMRERRRQRVSREIERAALRLFAERGFDRVTVDEIAAAIDIHPRTFFRYFTSKEAVLTGHPKEWLDDLYDAFTARAQQPAGKALREAAIASVAAYESDRETVLLRAKVAKKHPEAFARARGFAADPFEPLVEAVADRLEDDPARMRARLLVYNVVTTVQVALRAWIEQGAQRELSVLVEDAFEVVATELFTR